MLDGRRLNRYDYAIDDFEYGLYDRKALKRMWEAAEACIKPKSIQIYKNGSRWSVALHGEKLVRPLVFGTSGNSFNDDKLIDLFYNPEKYGYKQCNETQYHTEGTSSLRRFFTPIWDK